MDLRDALQETLGSGYTLERELGGGGMSRVFLVRDLSLDRRIVVKVLPPELAASVSVERFKREIMLVAALQHPHVVGVLSAGEIDGLPYFTMPFVEGESLRKRIERGGKLPLRETLSIAKDVARALAYAHERGIVHRDIKPDNVLLTAGSATVTDFGVAKALTQSRDGFSSQSGGTLTLIGTSLGTPAYMAPEQAAADPNTDHRADLYAFGVMVYEMLTGRPTFVSTTPQGLLAAHLTERPRPLEELDPEIPPRLASLVMQCLEKERENRPPTARAIVEALEDPAVISGTFTPPPAVKRAPRWPRAGVAAGVILALLGVAMTVRARMSAAPLDSAIVTPAASAVAPAKALVVLPLVSIGRDTADAYLADGMTTELINALSRVPGLRVASRTASFAYRDKYESAADIGKQLGVTMLLEGTVQREGNRMRVTARLVNTADGFMLWSDMFEREVRDVFAVQDELSNAIAETLGEQIGAKSPADVARGTANLEAYDRYLRGRFFFQKRGASSLRQAIVQFQAAVQKDPRFARAYAGLADSYALLPLYDRTPSDSVFPLALRAASQAVELDSTLAEAFASRAALLNASWRWTEAERDFKRAAQLDPAYTPAHQWYGEHLLVRGRAKEAVEALRRATQLDPVSPVAAASYATALSVSGKREEGIAQARRAVELDSSNTVARLMLGTVYVYAGRMADGVRELEVAAGLGRESAPIIGMLGYAYAANRQRDQAMGLLQSLAQRHDGDAEAAAAHIYLALGDTARALTSLEQAAVKRASMFSAESMTAPIFDSVRNSARFRGVLTATGLDAR